MCILCIPINVYYSMYTYVAAASMHMINLYDTTADSMYMLYVYVYTDSYNATQHIVAQHFILYYNMNCRLLYHVQVRVSQGLPATRVPELPGL